MTTQPTDDLTPYRELVCAIVRQAFYDYRRRNTRRQKQAVLFLQSREAQEFCEGWDIDLYYIAERLEG